MQQVIPWQKIQALQDEIESLRGLGVKKVQKAAKSSLYGLLKGIKITEKDFKEAEKAIFPHIK